METIIKNAWGYKGGILKIPLDEPDRDIR